MIDLSGNVITEIEGMAFNGLNNLKGLDLSLNHLSMLDAFSFSGLPNLEELDLSQNKIKLIGDGTLSLPKLRILNMNGNAAKLLPDNLFGTIPAQSPPLEYVDFGENKLTHIGSSLYGLQELKVLNLTANKKIADISLEALAQLPNLDVLLLSSSGFQFPLASIFTISPPEAAASVAVPTSDSPVTKLLLAQNKLIDPSVLRQLAYFRNLEVLSLEGNKFSYIDNVEMLPTWFPNLKTIYIGGNKLDCTWLNATVPLFAEAGVDVYTIAKIKTLGGTIYQRKVLDAGDCFDLGKIFSEIPFFASVFGKPAV